MTQANLFGEPQEPKVPQIAERPERVGLADLSYQDARTILTPASGFLDRYDYTLNPYSGCAFGCRYCYAAAFSPRPELKDTWGQWVKAKQNAAALMAKQKPGSLDGVRIYCSSVTDPYQPAERRLELTRGVLTALAESHRPKLVIQTRSPDVTRDADLFVKLAQNGGRVQVNMTVTTDNENIRKAFEPSCPSNDRRLAAVAELSALGVQTAVTMTPLLLVTDPESFARKVGQTGARSFIIQGFNTNDRKQFVAHTRDGAIAALAAEIGVDSKAEAARLYQRRYLQARKIIIDTLGADRVGEGRQGFWPPF